MSPKFPCIAPVAESFSSELLRVITNYWVEAYLEPDWVLNTDLPGKVL